MTWKPGRWVKIDGQWVALEYKLSALPPLKPALLDINARRDRWFTVLAVIATAGTVICIAAVLSGGVKPGALPSAPPGWVVP